MRVVCRDALQYERDSISESVCYNQYYRLAVERFDGGLHSFGDLGLDTRARPSSMRIQRMEMAA